MLNRIDQDEDQTVSQPYTINDQDKLLTVNINDTVPVPGTVPGYTLTPLFLDRENGTWVLYGRFDPGLKLPTHFHTGTVHFFTTKGRWNYDEYPNDLQTAGSYLYEPGGSMHTFSVPADATEPAEGFMVVQGANINFVDGKFHSIRDAGAIEDGLLAAVKQGLAPMPKYFRPGGAAESKE